MAREKTIRMHDNLSGQTLSNRYVLEEKLGAGGFAAVYRARDRRLNRYVAVKVLNEARSTNLRDIDRFRNEAGISAQIDDEHIVRVFDLGEDAGYVYFVMELLRGDCLRYRMRSVEAWPWRRACEMVEKLCIAVERAHEHNVAHRDIKPENLFVEVRRGREMVKLLDLGIAKVLSEVQWSWLAQNLSASDGFVGSPSYMAPEQAQGPRFCDLRVDIYAVGVVFYEMLTGDVPFRGHSAWETMLMHAQRPPLPPTARAPEAAIPPEVEAICLCALSKEPADRYPTIGAMAAALRDVLTRVPAPADEARPVVRGEAVKNEQVPVARASAGPLERVVAGGPAEGALSSRRGPATALARTEPALAANAAQVPGEACIFGPIHSPVVVPMQGASCVAAAPLASEPEQAAPRILRRPKSSAVRVKDVVINPGSAELPGRGAAAPGARGDSGGASVAAASVAVSRPRAEVESADMGAGTSAVRAHAGGVSAARSPSYPAAPWYYTPPLRWRTRFFLAYLLMGSTTASCAISTLLTFAMEPEYLERIAEQRRANVQMIDTSRSARAPVAEPPPARVSPARVSPPLPASHPIFPVPATDLPATDLPATDRAPRPEPMKKRVSPPVPKRRGEGAETPRRLTMAAIARRASPMVKDVCKITPFSPLTEATVDLVFTVEPETGTIEKVSASGEHPPLRQPDCVRDRASAAIGSFSGATDLRSEYRHSYTVLR